MDHGGTNDELLLRQTNASCSYWTVPGPGVIGSYTFDHWFQWPPVHLNFGILKHPICFATWNSASLTLVWATLSLVIPRRLLSSHYTSANCKFYFLTCSVRQWVTPWMKQLIHPSWILARWINNESTNQFDFNLSIHPSIHSSINQTGSHQRISQLTTHSSTNPMNPSTIFNAYTFWSACLTHASTTQAFFARHRKVRCVQATWWKSATYDCSIDKQN